MVFSISFHITLTDAILVWRLISACNAMLTERVWSAWDKDRMFSVAIAWESSRSNWRRLKWRKQFQSSLNSRTFYCFNRLKSLMIFTPIVEFERAVTWPTNGCCLLVEKVFRFIPPEGISLDAPTPSSEVPAVPYKRGALDRSTSAYFHSVRVKQLSKQDLQRSIWWVIQKTPTIGRPDARRSMIIFASEALSLTGVSSSQGDQLEAMPALTIHS